VSEDFERQVVSGIWGRWFEDLSVSLVIRHALTRTVTEADKLQFCLMNHNPQPLHLEAEFGQRLVNSLFTLGLLVGVSVSDTTMGTTVAKLGFDETNFPAPIFLGDTLCFGTEVVTTRTSGSRPDAGIVKFEHRVYKLRDGLICCTSPNALMLRNSVSSHGCFH